MADYEGPLSDEEKVCFLINTISFFFLYLSAL